MLHVVRRTPRCTLTAAWCVHEVVPSSVAGTFPTNLHFEGEASDGVRSLSNVMSAFAGAEDIPPCDRGHAPTEPAPPARLPLCCSARDVVAAVVPLGAAVRIFFRLQCGTQRSATAR